MKQQMINRTITSIELTMVLPMFTAEGLSAKDLGVVGLYGDIPDEKALEEARKIIENKSAIASKIERIERMYSLPVSLFVEAVAEYENSFDSFGNEEESDE